MGASPSEPKTKTIVGLQPAVDRAAAAWALLSSDIALVPLVLPQDASFRFDFSGLDNFSPDKATAFVALDECFLNLQRAELYHFMKWAGFMMPPLVHPQSIIDTSATIGDNAWIGQGALIGANVNIGANGWIGAGAYLHQDTHLAESVTVKEGAVIGCGSQLGAYATIGPQAILKPGTHVGAASRLMKTGPYQGHYPDGTFSEDLFEAAIIS